MSSFCVENFGCRAARADGEAVSARLRTTGMAEVLVSDADVVIVNTCSVTAEADRDARAFVRKARRINPAAKIVVTGCYAQRAPGEIAALDGVTAVIGNSHKGLLPEIVQGIAAGVSRIPAELTHLGSIWADDQFAHSFLEETQVLPGAQTRPNLKIQEGCGNRCTFCVIPTTRGHSRSLPREKVLAQVRGFVAGGGQELVLSGINLGRWGRDLADARSFSSLVGEILAETPLPRLRLSSIEPMDWTPELIGLMGEFGGTRLARHAHLPLQSGSDGVLRRMHRRYRPWHYTRKAAALVEAGGAELCLGADVMVGFPGESEGEFRETWELIRELPFAYLHLFPFSPRPGTPGWELHRQSPVSARAVQERMAELRALAEAKTRSFRQSMVGRKLPAITLHTREDEAAKGHTSVLTENYLPAILPQVLPANRLIDVRLGQLRGDGVLLGHAEAFAARM